MNIKEASERTGVSSAAIRYYEKELLIPAIDRSETGNREIDNRIIRRINFVKQMRAAGMSIENLRKYIQLFDSQEENDQEQQDLLREQLTEMEERRDDLQAAIDHLHFKLDHFYDHMKTTESEMEALEREHDAKVEDETK
ncbi:MerR family transcriptional regulator [Secundilactobacillus paracollinoides]|uniref:MerR family transcriptional regulator n=1 Tax=Secundilactobacillus paracollinoides TaxID=240427 RepID=A0A1B2J0L6_9LACO|nr:MerR family transcriptional regulator [Secundilactobacillus paracollinoides]ANZ67855.1 MerR family transcriptional regulator [Secundilactobacillus paracollinoides]KRL79265.1 MerR family transcriptional regulator protein [Secundilactobacillus paracollinoides DSM 15502 = JCM 11969]